MDVTSADGFPPSQHIDMRIAELGDWRGETLAQVRGLILRALPSATEEWKWRGVPVWYQDGMVCTGETYQDTVKLTFAKGAQLEDPHRLFNASMEGSARRAIDLRQGDKLDETAFTDLVLAAAALNTPKPKSARKPPAKKESPVTSLDVFSPYLDGIDQVTQRPRMEAVLRWVMATFPQLTPRIAWNQPMFTLHGTFIIGFSVSKGHMALSPEAAGIPPFHGDILNAGYSYTKQLVRLPWALPVDYGLLEKIISFNLEDKAGCTTFWRK